MATKVYPTNLQFLKRSYGSRTEGEIFAMRLVTGPYLFGRVIVTNSPSGAAPMPGSNLIYVYRERSETPVCDHRGLTPDRLLLAPIWTNRQSWTRGYFIKVGQAPLEPWMLLDHHCFSAPNIYRGAGELFFGLRGERLTARFEPCGSWGLASYRRVDDRISDAVGIARVPDDNAPLH